MEKYECGDCLVMVHDHMLRMRKPFFKHEHMVADDGSKCVGVGVCSECIEKWPDEYVIAEPEHEGLLS